MKCHPSLKFDWKSSVPCLLITLVLSSSERVRDQNLSTQPRLSLSYTLFVCCPTDMCSSASSTDLDVLAHAGSGHSNTSPKSLLLSASPLSCVLSCVFMYYLLSSTAHSLFSVVKTKAFVRYLMPLPR